MDKSRRDKPLVWGASEDNEFQDWAMNNHPDVYEEWELFVFPHLDLYEYLEQEEYEVLDEWLSHE